jgi:hypothetical protein
MIICIAFHIRYGLKQGDALEYAIRKVEDYQDELKLNPSH